MDALARLRYTEILQSLKNKINKAGFCLEKDLSFLYLTKNIKRERHGGAKRKPQGGRHGAGKSGAAMKYLPGRTQRRRQERSRHELSRNS